MRILFHDEFEYDNRSSRGMYLLVQIALIMFTVGFSDFIQHYTDFSGAGMAGSGRFPGWRVPTPIPGWQSCRPPADPEEDH